MRNILKQFTLLSLALLSVNLKAHAYETATLVQPLDHANPTDSRTFNQRYFFDDQYAQDEFSPVFLFICGEEVCSPNRLDSSFGETAEKFHAYRFALEHRYFGQSSAFTEFTTENLKQLTVENAIEDIAQFITQIKKLKNLKGPWIVIGASYPGDLAAFVRQKYPDLVLGALASSAPVLSRYSYSQMDSYLSKIAGEACATQVRAVTSRVEMALRDTKSSKEVKAKFGAQGLEDPGDVLYWIADIAASAIQFGYRDEFCGALTSASDEANGDGDSAEAKEKLSLDAYAAFALRLKQEWGITPETNEVQGSIDPRPSTERAWFYIECTEFANWEDASPNPEQRMRSSQLNSDYDQHTCQRLFGINAVQDVSHWNNNFYQPLLDPKTSHIFFTNGSEDPWMPAGISPENGNANNPNTEAFTIHDAAHGADMASSSSDDSQSLKDARSRFQTLIRSWLNSYQAH